MDKNILAISSSEVKKFFGERATTNDNLTLFEVDCYDDKKIRELINADTQERILRNENEGMFYYLFQGTVSLEINQQRYDLCAGDVCCMFKTDYFRITDVSSDARLFVMLMHSCEFMFKVDNVLLLLSFREKIGRTRSFRLKEKTSRAMSALYALMRETFEDKELVYRDAVIQEYLHIMFYYMSSDLFSDNSVVPQPTVALRSEELLMQFVRLVSQHYREHRKVTFYAGKMCITPKYLSTIVYETSGRYARDIIADFVIGEAKRCLLSTTMTVQEISLYLHFSCQSFFGKYFREHTGCSPLAYRHSPHSQQ